METYLAIKPRHSRGGDPSMEMMLWGQQEDEVRR
jgi:hypothetical protein